jgi:hypothetical protein
MLEKGQPVLGYAAPALLSACLWFGACNLALSADLSFAEQVSRAEKALSGEESKEQSIDDRLRSMEVSMFGKARKGNFKKRLDVINDMLGVEAKKNVPATEASASPPLERPVQVEARPAANEEKSASLPNAPASAIKEETPIAPAKTEALAPLPKAEPVSPAKKAELVPLKAQTAKMGMPPVAPERKKTSDPFAPATSAVVSPEAIRQLMRGGLQKFSQGDNAEAQRLFNEVLLKEPKNVDALYNLGVLAERRGDLSGALSDYKKALQVKGADPELQEAVGSVERQIARRDGKVLVGNAHSDAFAGQAQVPTAASPYLGVSQQYPTIPVSQGSDPAMINVHQPNNPTLSIRQKSLAKHTFGTVMSIGAGFALRGSPLHCPVCGMLRGF